jgi:hypothetical protein
LGLILERFAWLLQVRDKLNMNNSKHSSSSSSASASATAPLEKSNAEYFRDMDAEFMGIKQIEDDTFQYHAQDVLIQNHWELPIVIQNPNSYISYKFASSPVCKRMPLPFCVHVHLFKRALFVRAT